MKRQKSKIDIALRGILALVLFVVPILLTAIIWFTPELETNKLLVGVSTLNGILGIAEVIFLVRAAIFPKDGILWWLND